MTKEQLEKCSKILNHFGTVNQMVKTIEECSELSVKIAKAIPNCNDLNGIEIEQIEEEIADVLIMINQMIKLLSNQDEIDRIIEYKLNRTLDRYEIK